MSTSVGPNNPTAASGTAWSTPTGIESTSSSATKTISSGDANTTSALVGTGFGFSIPAGATITGIQVSMSRRLNSTALFNVNFSSASVKLLKAGTPVGTGTDDGLALWSTSLVASHFGSVSSLWGTTWTPSDINNANFGVQATVDYDNGSAFLRTMYVNNYQITVTYTPGSSDASATPSGVSVTMTAHSPTCTASSSASPAGVSLSLVTGAALGGGQAMSASPSGVSLSMSLGAVLAGVGINWGNVVSGSSTKPAAVNGTYFYYRAVGTITPSQSGLYTLGVNASDGVNLFIAGQPLVKALTASQTANGTATYTNSGQMTLGAGSSE